MLQHGRTHKNADELDWEEIDEFDFPGKSFKKRSGKQTENRKADARRRVEDHQEKRRLRKRVRSSFDSWDDSDFV